MLDLNATPNLMMKDAHRTEMAPYECILGHTLREFLAELLLVNGRTVLYCICKEEHASLADLIDSSTEMSLKPGRLSYSNVSDIEFDWGSAPSIAIAMEMQSREVTVFFRVFFQEGEIGVDIGGIQFKDATGDKDAKLQRFAEAVFDARRRGLATAGLRFQPANVSLKQG